MDQDGWSSGDKGRRLGRRNTGAVRASLDFIKLARRLQSPGGVRDGHAQCRPRGVVDEPVVLSAVVGKLDRRGAKVRLDCRRRAPRRVGWRKKLAAPPPRLGPLGIRRIYHSLLKKTGPENVARPAQLKLASSHSTRATGATRTFEDGSPRTSGTRRRSRTRRRQVEGVGVMRGARGLRVRPERRVGGLEEEQTNVRWATGAEP